MNGMEIFEVILSGTQGHPRGTCGGCSRHLWDEPVYRVPGLAGVYCSVDCIECVLFGEGRCRWCGEPMDKPYTSVDSRLCSDDCSESYYAHVLGDRTARLGTGKRLMLWLQRKQPKAYRQVAGADAQGPRVCRNPGCRNGEDGQPASLDHLKATARYCSDACGKQDKRSSNRQKSARNRQCLRGVYPDTFAGQGYEATLAFQEGFRGALAGGEV
jgi:hypothetical protein